jgi:hypothetical protein
MSSPLSQRDLFIILAAAAAMGGLAQRELLPGQRMEFVSDRFTESRPVEVERSTHIATTQDWKRFINGLVY